MKSQEKIKKEIEDLNLLFAFLTLCPTCQSLLNYSNEIIEEIDKLNISKYNWTVDGFITELKFIIGSKEKDGK
jgi:hypothetical protein